LRAELDSKWFLLFPSFIRRKIAGRHNLQRILGNTAWLFFDKILRVAVALSVGVWVARYLGPERYGALNFAAAFVALFGALATLGLDGIVVRDIVRTPEKKYEILASAFVLKLGGGIIAFCVSLIAMRIMRPLDSQTQWLVGIIAAGMIFQAFDAIDLWFQLQLQSIYAVCAKNAASILIAISKVLLILNHASLIAFAWAGLTEIVIGAMGLFWAYRVTNQHLASWQLHLSTSKALLRESWPLILSSLAIMMYMRIDQIMLGQILGNKEVGLYSAALKFSEVWYFIPMVIVSSVMPNLTETIYASPELFYQRLKHLFTILIRIAYAIAIPMTLLSRPLLVQLYGKEYAGAGAVLSIHIWASLFVFLGVGMSPWILNEGLTKYSLFQTVSGAMMNIVLNLLIIPSYGAIGASISTVISQGFSAFLSNLLLPKTRTIFKYQLKALLQIP
jgi:polysaccharide transporter, PST family